MTLPARYPPIRVVLAWTVHFYTALGLVCAAGMAASILKGTAFGRREAYAWMIAATLIDATDGWLARRAEVRLVLPRFDGRRLDDITDFLTYTVLPLFLLWQARVLPHDLAPCLLLPLLASAYGFSQADIKTDDGSFLGFPSLWNVVALYLDLLRPPDGVTIGVLVAFTLLTFVPLRYPYPSQPGRLNRMVRVIAVFWGMLLAWIIWRIPTPYTDFDSTLIHLSLLPPLGYVAIPWVRLLRPRRSSAR